MFVQHRNLPRKSANSWLPERKGLLDKVLADYYILWENEAPIPDDQPKVTKADQDIINGLIEGNDRSRAWINYVDQLDQVFPDNQVKRETRLQPAMGVRITVQEQTLGELTAKKTLHLYQSLLGPFFTVFGVDEVHYYNGTYYTHQFDPIITAAPIEEYEQAFMQLWEHHQTHFPASHFMSFNLARFQHPGLQTSSTSHTGDNSWLEALFTSRDFGQYSFRGDMLFGLDQWWDMPKNGGWTAYPPGQTPG
ncbi:MAG: hypothetical protein AAFO03_10055 [Bacteroidota bacterium]